ncbi:MAG TPA: efflux RND transporter periplasmic adaptor subunit [Hyphomicrobiaceae bacterium]|jgi:HlyD family secretion protein|nr:efflux RND transporter periplasmic adaptor subunit [Hyphomicrobiaceae bacterium]
MSGKYRYYVVLALFAVGLVLANVGMPALWTGAGSTFLYEVAEVSQGPIRKLVATSGPVRALVTVSVSSQLSGQIRDLKVDFNSEVRAGDELAIIDDKTFAAKVAQAQADLVAARAMMLNHEAALAKAEAIERNAKRLMQRQEALASKGIAATTTLDVATRDAEVAKAEIEVAKAQLENTKATIAQREAQLLQAQIDLDRTRIRSPIDGTVIGRTVDVGQIVAASLQAPELFKIAQDLRRIRIEAQVNEADVGIVAEGNPVEFTVDAYPERRFQGKVSQVRLGALELNNVVTYTVMIEAENDDRKLLPGMTANARIETAKLDEALRIPTDALRFKPRPADMAAATQNPSLQQVKLEVERAKLELGLNEEQLAKVNATLKAAAPEPSSPGGSAAAGNARPNQAAAETEARVLQRLKYALASVVSEQQRSAFEAWKARFEGAARKRRDVTVWVLGPAGAIESRQVRLGLADDDFAEIIGDGLKEGDRVVLRSREAGKK